MPRIFIVIAALVTPAPVLAEVSCGDLVAISQRAIDLRNEGASLSRVLADTEDSAMKQRFTAIELDFIRLLIRESFMGGYSPYDVKEACEDGRLAIPVQKSGKPK